MLHFFHIKHCKERGKCTHAVILSISKHHAAVQSAVAGLSCRNYLKLCGEEIFLFHVIILFQKIDYICFYSLFFFLFKSLILLNRAASDQKIKFLSFYNRCSLFLHLFRSEMDQQICDNKDRIIFFLTNTYLNCCAIFLCDHSVKGKWKRHPLIFLDSTIIMCIKISKLLILIQRILLYVNTRRIDVSSKNIHSICQRFCTHMEQRDCLVHTHSIKLVSGFHFFTVFNDVSDILISLCFCLFNCQCNTLALCLTGIKAVLVFCIHLF